MSVNSALESATPEDTQGWNRYTYGRNNPLFYRDPDGRILETLWDAANVGLGILGDGAFNARHAIS